jgi:acyl-CoA hydrolase
VSGCSLALVRLAAWKTAAHMEPRHPAETVSVLTSRMGVQDANIAGNVHGGWIMKLCDDVAVIAATRHAGGRVVTALTMVALDDDEQPRAIPPLVPATSADERRHEQAQLRREVRLAEPGELRRVDG